MFYNGFLRFATDPDCTGRVLTARFVQLGPLRPLDYVDRKGLFLL